MLRILLEFHLPGPRPHHNNDFGDSLVDSYCPLPATVKQPVPALDAADDIYMAEPCSISRATPKRAVHDITPDEPHEKNAYSTTQDALQANLNLSMPLPAFPFDFKYHKRKTQTTSETLNYPTRYDIAMLPIGADPRHHCESDTAKNDATHDLENHCCTGHNMLNEVKITAKFEGANKEDTEKAVPDSNDNLVTGVSRAEYMPNDTVSSNVSCTTDCLTLYTNDNSHGEEKKPHSEEISSTIHLETKLTAATHLSGQVNDDVATVPDYITDSQRLAANETKAENKEAEHRPPERHTEYFPAPRGGGRIRNTPPLPTSAICEPTALPSIPEDTEFLTEQLTADVHLTCCDASFIGEKGKEEKETTTYVLSPAMQQAIAVCTAECKKHLRELRSVQSALA